MSINKKRGSIALARSLCYEIAGATSEDDISGSDYGSVDIAEILSAEVERLREALAQPEQEPVEQYAKLAQHCAMLEHKLMLSEQEPSQWRDIVVVALVREGINKHKARELADHFAAQRKWVGLEPEEILDLFDLNNVYGSKWIEFARTVEAKLKNKNT